MTKTEFTFRPIGVVHTPFTEPKGTPIQGALASDVSGTIEIFERFREGLSDLEGFSHIYVLYVFDRSEGYKLKVKPYLDTQERGLFATRAPKRPNPIGLTVVRLNGVSEGVLQVSGLDMLDETPVLDIKPYVPKFDGVPQHCRCGWVEKPLAAGDTPRYADERFHTRDEG